MNQRRTHIISRRPFGAAGVAVDADSYSERLQIFKQELESDIPSIKTLEASVIRLLCQPSGSQITLIAMLEESDQINLVEERTGRSIYDAFVNDVRRTEADQANVELRIILAQSPATNPYLDETVGKTRRRLRNAYLQSDLTIWSSPSAKSMPLFDCPRYLPNSPTTHTSVRVLELSPKRAVVELMEDVSLSDSCDRVVLQGTKHNLLRVKNHRSVASGSILQQAMDSKAECLITFAVVLLWESGEISHLELLNFLEQTPT